MKGKTYVARALEIASNLPPLAGFIGLIYLGLADTVGEKLGLQLTPDSKVTLTLVIVCLIAASVGVERYTLFRVQHRKLDQLTLLLDSNLPSRFIEGHEAVYEEATRCLKTASHSVKILLYATTPPAPESYIRTLISHIKAHPDVFVDVVIALDMEMVEERFWSAHATRYSLFLEAGVENQVRRFILDTRKPFGFDLLIIDQNVMNVGFSPGPTSNERTKEFAVVFHNQPKLVGRFKDWYDNHLLISGEVRIFESAYTEWRRKMGKWS